jgi:hypothetical protein
VATVAAKLFGGVAAIHAAEYFIAAALQGDVQVVADIGTLLHQGQELTIDLGGFQGANAIADGPELPGQGVKQRYQGTCGREILAIIAEMNAGEDDFAVAA